MSAVNSSAMDSADPAVSAPARWEGVLATLVANRGDALTRYAFYVCGSHEDAADLVQDALVKTFGRLRNGFTVESAESYVRRAILTTWVDRGRRATRWRKIAHLNAEPELIESSATDTDARIDLHEELRKLTPRERACLVLRYYEDLKVDDIAASLELSSGAVKRYLSDGLAKMAVSLSEDAPARPQLKGLRS
jgi:RNA polymerase sigma factor (sigma-70 family)